MSFSTRPYPNTNVLSALLCSPSTTTTPAKSGNWRKASPSLRGGAGVRAAWEKSQAPPIPTEMRQGIQAQRRSGSPPPRLLKTRGGEGGGKMDVYK